MALGLIPAGAAAGAIAGALGAAIWISVIDSVRAALDLQVLGLAGIVGAAFGAIMLPLAGFTLLRYVPLGRALLETIVATALGGVLGVQFLGDWWPAGPIGGFALAATRLWLIARRRRSPGNVSPP
ncbi:MAG TPA: hypothetical protein VEB59_14785 [Gemmatimonadales bacterium]|nr:hypothetical protein [Gemmatimonadales bacterium]